MMRLIMLTRLTTTLHEKNECWKSLTSLVQNSQLYKPKPFTRLGPCIIKTATEEVLSHKQREITP